MKNQINNTIEKIELKIEKIKLKIEKISLNKRNEKVIILLNERVNMLKERISLILKKEKEGRRKSVIIENKKKSNIKVIKPKRGRPKKKRY